jgi:hypothetical protein
MLVLVLAVTFSTIAVPNVRAQSTSITNLQAPSTATVGTDVIVTVAATYDLGSNGYAVGIGIFDLDASQWVSGAAQSSQNKCQPLTGQAANHAFCLYLPASTSGSDVVTLDLIFSSVKTYRLRAEVELFDSNAQLISGANTFQDFSIAVQSSPQGYSGVQSTSITSLQAPSTATVGTDVMVTVGVKYELGSAFAVSVGISEIGASNWTTGSATSSLAPCHAGQSNLAFCWYPTTISGSDIFRFDLKFNSTKTYNLRVSLQLYDPTTHKVIPSATTTQDFSITVVSAATTSQTTQTYTTSTPALQMPQPPQPETTQSTNNTQQLVLALAVIAAVVIGAAFLYARRKGQTVKIADTAVAPSSMKTAEGKRFCNECGNELPPNLKFCDSCGTEQS